MATRLMLPADPSFQAPQVRIQTHSPTPVSAFAPATPPHPRRPASCALRCCSFGLPCTCCLDAPLHVQGLVDQSHLAYSRAWLLQ